MPFYYLADQEKYNQAALYCEHTFYCMKRIKSDLRNLFLNVNLSNLSSFCI